MVPEAQPARPCSNGTKRGSGTHGLWAHGGGRGWVRTRSVRAIYAKRPPCGLNAGAALV